MVRQMFLVAVAVVICAAPPAYGQEIKLQLKFKEGEKFWVEDVATLKETITVMGQEIKVEAKTTTITSYAIKKVTPDGLEMVMKIEDVKTEGNPGPVDVMSKIKGAVLNISMTPSGKVKKVEGFEEFVKQLAGEDEVAKVMKELLTEDMFTKGLDQSFGFLPDKAVKPGDTWTRDSKFPLGPLGDLKMNNVYTFTGKKDGAEDIKVKFNMQYAPPKPGGKGAFGGLIKVVRGDLKGDGKGTYIFDADKGRVVSSTGAMKVQGTMTIDAAGQEGQLDMSIENSTVSRVLDTNPIKNRP